MADSQPKKSGSPTAFRLSPLAQRLLFGCALLDTPLDPATLLVIGQQTNLFPDSTTPLQIGKAVNQLRSLGLLHPDLRCPADSLEITARRAAAKPALQRLLRGLIAETLPLPDSAPAARTHSTRHLRLAVLSHDIDAFHTGLLRYFDLAGNERHPHPILTICANPFDPRWFGALPLPMQLYAISELWKAHLLHLEPLSPLRDYLSRRHFMERLPTGARPAFLYFRLAILLIQGDLAGARAEIDRAGQALNSLGIRGWHALVANDPAAALDAFADDLEQLRRLNKNPHAYFTGIEGLFYLLALLRDENFRHLSRIAATIQDVEAIQPHNAFLPAYRILAGVVALLESRVRDARKQLHGIDASSLDSITALFYGNARYWLDKKLPAAAQALLAKQLHRAISTRFNWLAAEYAALLEAIGNKPAGAGPTPVFPLHQIVRHQEPWQRALKALEKSGPSPDDVPERHSRLAWWLRFDEESRLFDLAPRVQQRTSKGGWSKGRPISLKKLRQPDALPCATGQDRAICAAIIEVHENGIKKIQFDRAQALTAISGHPHLFLADNPTMPVSLEQGEPELTVEEHGTAITVRLAPFPQNATVAALRQTRTRYKMVLFTEEHLRVASIIGPHGLRIPQAARAELMTTLGSMASYMLVHSSLPGTATGMKTVAPDNRIRVHLLPFGTGLRAGMYVRPLGTAGPYFKPGEGPLLVAGKVGDQHLQTRRDLAGEMANAEEVETACPVLTGQESLDREWILEKPEHCLEVLEELRTLVATVMVEWPEGERFTISPPAHAEQLYIAVHKKNNWFELGGHLQLDDALVLDMRKLLELTQVAASRFIPLGQGHFLTLSNELRKQLDEIRAYAELRKHTVRMHPLAALAFDVQAANNPRFQADSHWHQLHQRVRESNSLEPELPSTLRAELRDYQLEGFRWLSRLAHLEVGGCLADDMGLGKTIQALAVIVARAQHGPTMVVAPTSVCLNWQDEANRFAPTLNTILFGGRRRKALLQDLKAFDVVIVSYGLLQQDAEALAQTEWQTIVLDEAQAIKNFLTKRSRAAMKLNGRFKFITTGTPIENHLAELWNLFQFINPGLLGSLDQFNKRFVVPIEKSENQEVKRRLKKLVQPFILRRIKSQVLEELPPRTEITLQVSMNRQEAALYEALRQKAMERLRFRPTPPRNRHLQILAEIMRLRRACCNPRLILPDTDMPSSKLDLFGKVLGELLENRHKALVFSQFVDHLHILRDYLKEQRISYQYLDGKTPAVTRQKRVEAFQGGAGDVFLISLKAGGMGLNLTAADYVIHMDPWWNPAVEDQASDRAHRIGQQHPVTIYRLITTGSIEEKICRLHAQKRELAESLLQGTNIGRPIAADELLQLLSEGQQESP